MKRLLILAGVLAVLFFACSKDKIPIVTTTAPPPPPPASYCDSMKTAGKVSYKCFVDSVVKAKCVSCHVSGGSAPTDFTTYTGVKNSAATIADRIQPTPPSGGARMPQGGTYLSTDTIAKIQSWVTDSAKNN